MSENPLAGSIKPYMIRAVYEWCTDLQLTPHIAVYVDEHTQVPMQYVKDQQIVLNISMQACPNLRLENDWIYFSARFAGKSEDVRIPVGHVLHIFARENGEGMGFDLQIYTPKEEMLPEMSATIDKTTQEESATEDHFSGSLKVVKRKKKPS